MTTLHTMNRRQKRADWRKHYERLKILAVQGHTLKTYPSATITLGVSADAFARGDYLTLRRQQG